MKKKLLVLFFTLLILFPVYASKEYVQAGINLGYSKMLHAKTVGAHALYQFGASLSDSVELGFGNDMELDVTIAQDAKQKVSFDMLCGVAGAARVNDSILVNFLAGPCLSLWDDGTTAGKEGIVGFGAGASGGITFFMSTDQNESSLLGLTLGATGAAVWDRNNKFFAKLNGFAGITVGGPLMFSHYHEFGFPYLLY